MIVTKEHMTRLLYHMAPKAETEEQVALTLAHHDFEKGLNAYAFFKTNSHSISDDLVQDTFVKTWKYLITKGKIHLMKAFLYHVLNNLIIDEYRKKKLTSLDTLLEKGFEPSVDDSEKLLNVLDGKAALLLINRLPKKYQEVLRLRYVKSLSLKEISALTHSSTNTVAVQIHRGLKKLKDLYDHK